MKRLQKRIHAGDTIALVVGGGPAPGINGVISAATIEARNDGLNVLGILDGFRWLIEEGKDMQRQRAVELHIEDVSRIHSRGGSILRTSRANPATPAQRATVRAALAALGVRGLITIGGDDTLTTAMRLHAEAAPRLQVVHVPKTIDNDLPLPRGVPTFGFETARHYGVEFIRRIMTDAQATGQHWHIVVTMGRSAGHLALGIGKGAGAHLTLIPEEFRAGTVTIEGLGDIIEGSILKRRADGHNHGVVILAEGLVLKMAHAYVRERFGTEGPPRDPHGNLQLGSIELGREVCRELEHRFAVRGTTTFVHEKLGYDLRSADPISSDLLYTRNLGYGAVRALLEGHRGVLVTFHGQVFRVLPFRSLPGAPDKLRARLVNTRSDSYAVARKYMIRLGPEDRGPEQLRRLARAARMTIGQFRVRFNHLLGGSGR